jgi:hypothetical protein
VSAPAGWYPDPGGRRGAYRYWDGRVWSSTTQDQVPRAPHPPGTPPPIRPGHTRRSPIGWIIALAALVLVIVVVVVLAVRIGNVLGGGPFLPGQNPSEDVCPQPDPGSAAPQPNDGRVHAGRLSYPTLGAPWAAPKPDYRVAFGRDVVQQYVEVESGDFGQYSSWGGAVLIGELVAGDGFFTPRDGAAIVVKCVTGTFYGDTEVTRDDRKNAATTVDGREAWIIESELGFDVPNLKAKHELLIIVIVDTGDGSGGLFFASIPENAPELVAPARRALAALTVD